MATRAEFAQIDRRQVLRNAWVCGAVGGILGGILGGIPVVVLDYWIALNSVNVSNSTVGLTSGTPFLHIVYRLFVFLGFLLGVLLGIAFARRRRGSRKRPGTRVFMIREFDGRSHAEISGEIRDFIRILEGDDPRLHGLALTALDHAGSEATEAVSVLARHLNHPNHACRESAASALRQIGPAAREAVPALVRALEDNDFNGCFEGRTHYHALWALGTIGPASREAVPVLSRLCEGAKTAGASELPEYRECRMSVTAVLAKIAPERFPPEEAVATLIAALKNEDRQVHEGVLLALGEMGPLAKEAVPALIEELAGPARYEAVVALGKIGPDAKEAVPALTAALSDPGYIRRNVLVGAISRVCDKVQWSEHMRRPYGTSEEFILWNLKKIDPQAAENASIK